MILERTLLFCVLTASARAVEIRVATFNIGAHFNAEGNIDYSLNSPGTADYESVLAILARIDADVVALEEIAPADIAGDPDSLDALAGRLGYSYRYTASATQAPPLAGPIDTTLRVTFLSRFPFLETAAIRSPEGARELTRLFPVVAVDVPGTDRDPMFAAVHLKSGTGTADRYRRAIEMTRLAGFVADRNFAPGANFILTGDFNLSSTTTTFAAPPAGLPISFHLGADLAALPSIAYSLDPTYYFGGNLPVRLDPRQRDGSAATYETGSTIDLFLVSPAMARRPIATEIYNSTLDTGNGLGLAKAGFPLASGTSAVASDHYAVFGDFELDEDFPPMTVTLADETVSEGGEISLTITLPEIRAEDVTVSMTADDATMLLPPELVIPAGSLAGNLRLHATRNFRADGARSVTFTATAAGTVSGSAMVEILDVDGPYVLTGLGAMVAEDFTGFAGGHDPAPWISAGGSWLGTDNGTSSVAGFRSYGEGSPGYLSGGGTGTMQADFINGSGCVLTDIQVGFTAARWRVVTDGSADKIEVSLVQNGAEISLPELAFAAETAVRGEPVANSGTVSGLLVMPGEAFRLKFSFVPGPPVGGSPADIFINEFHYDNKGADAGEFVEIVTGPGFAESPGDVNLILYNGGDGKTYGSVHPLSSFTAGDITNVGYHIYSKVIAGIQNGDPDGFAVAVGGVVKQFISYGGTFAATNGPALGLVSSDVGVKQNAADAGFAAIGLTGSGGLPGDFRWNRFDGLAHTPGNANSGQSFVLPTGSQGISIDDVRVTVLPSSDRDGDGYSDADEIVFGTDPMDAGSRISVSIGSPALAVVRVDFPSVVGRSYVIQSSSDLMNWSAEGSFVGTGDGIEAELPREPEELKRFYRVGASFSE